MSVPILRGMSTSMFSQPAGGRIVHAALIVRVAESCQLQNIKGHRSLGRTAATLKERLPHPPK